MTDYYNKYLTYKTKYLELKNNDMVGGDKNNKILFILFQGGEINLKKMITLNQNFLID